MQTEIMEFSENALAHAKNLILDSHLVAFATETVYGLGANAYDDNAVKKIFLAKGRPQDNPLIVHIADFSQWHMAARRITKTAELLAENFMPGAITLVMEKNDKISEFVSCGLDTVGIRVPSHFGARKFLQSVDVPIAAPSANTSKRPSPTTAAHVYADMRDKISLILDGGSCEVGIESTVVDVTANTPIILRRGIITGEMIESVCGSVGYIETAVGVPASPGMKYIHYAPKCRMVMITGNIAEKIEKYYTNRTVIVGYDSIESLVLGKNYVSIGKDNIVASNRFYGILRQVECDYDLIILQEPIPDEVGLSLKNRMTKACSGNID